MHDTLSHLLTGFFLGIMVTCLAILAFGLPCWNPGG